MEGLLKSFLSSLALVLLGSAVIWMMMGCPETGIDDADIFLVYARHWADGHGFVYNIGGARVEGFTSMLWTLLCAGWFKLTDAVELPLLLMNIGLASVTVWLGLTQVKQRKFYLLFLASAPAWFAWSVCSLMESGLWTLLLTGMMVSLLSRRLGWFTLCIGLMLPTRPEAMLWCAWAIGLWGLRQGWRAALLPGFAYVIILMGLVGFRLFYFGAPVPNTYYAKVSGEFWLNIGRGTLYLLGFMFSHPLALFGVAAVVGSLILWWKDDRFNWTDQAILAMALLPGLGIPVLVGGDHFGAHRFYQPIWPMLMVLLLWRGYEWMQSRRRLSMALAVVCLILWVLFPFTSRLKHEFRLAREGQSNGTALMQLFEEEPTLPRIGVITAGGIKRTYTGTVLDLMGLNSIEMARSEEKISGGIKNHAAFKKSVFWEWTPDLVVCGDSRPFDNKVLRGLLSDERFLDQYQYFEPDINKGALRFYLHRDYPVPATLRAADSPKPGPADEE